MISIDLLSDKTGDSIQTVSQPVSTDSISLQRVYIRFDKPRSS
jgi:hypothetical protein